MAGWWEGKHNSRARSACGLCTGNYLPKWKNKQDKAQRNWFAFSAFLCWNQICTLIVHCTKVMHRSLRNFTHPPPPPSATACSNPTPRVQNVFQMPYANVEFEGQMSLPNKKCSKFGVSLLRRSSLGSSGIHSSPTNVRGVYTILDCCKPFYFTYLVFTLKNSVMLTFLVSQPS